MFVLHNYSLKWKSMLQREWAWPPYHWVIITLRQGLNQHQTLASRGGKTTERVETIQFSHSLVIYPSLQYYSRLQLPNRCLFARIPPISFTMVTSGIKVGGQAARASLEFHCGYKTNKNKSFSTALSPRWHNRTHAHSHTNLSELNQT